MPFPNLSVPVCYGCFWVDGLEERDVVATQRLCFVESGDWRGFVGALGCGAWKLRRGAVKEPSRCGGKGVLSRVAKPAHSSLV